MPGERPLHQKLQKRPSKNSSNATRGRRPGHDLHQHTQGEGGGVEDAAAPARPEAAGVGVGPAHDEPGPGPHEDGVGRVGPVRREHRRRPPRLRARGHARRFFCLGDDSGRACAVMQGGFVPWRACARSAHTHAQTRGRHTHMLKHGTHTCSNRRACARSARGRRGNAREILCLGVPVLAACLRMCARARTRVDVRPRALASELARRQVRAEGQAL